ncbi:Molybdopterin biosynthesis protein MoeA / Periplasmic molybdate-binding domain protein [Lachnospiraceae bacterium TWA4]|nr:Molybdopterin biosynthesis protein MoeA / Periplasmic molybdate-binding domain protein [Lachnospiraceae bacterium TWA4]
MEKRNFYLKNTPVKEARNRFLETIYQTIEPSYEVVSSMMALNRVTRHAIYAKCSAPHYNAAAMDGIAVVAAKTSGASDLRPVVLAKEDYQFVNTGNVIVEPFNAVIMVEDLLEKEDGRIELHAPAVPWQHIRPIGEDIVAGEMILPSGHSIRAIDVGVLLEAGILEVEVVKKPTVAIFPTGSEIVEPSDDIKEGQIIESNSRMFENMVIECGATPKRFSIVKDEPDKIYEALSNATKEFDVVIINAGTSKGSKDFTVPILRELGEVLVHGVAVKPGKPCALAIVNGKPVIALPGYPVSAYIGFINFVTPVLDYLGQKTSKIQETIKAVISKRLISGLKYEEYVRVKVGRVGDQIVAAPLQRGAGAAMSLVRADGFCVIPQNCEGVEAGEEVSISLYRPLKEVENTAVLIGSHDLILDVMADMMSNLHKNFFLSSTHVGSMGGLMSLKRKEAHMAPTHLLDEETGVYNISYLKRLFNEPMALIKGVDRIQGLMVPKGNPLNIKSLEDIVGKRYINRQRGAGTRVLLDYKLKQLGISTDEIDGYEREANTHMTVAAAVAGGSADAGMGVLSAANAMGLDFVEIGVEEYDFAIPVKYLDLPVVQEFIKILKSKEFHKKLEEMGGYGTSHSGEIVYI